MDGSSPGLPSFPGPLALLYGSASPPDPQRMRRPGRLRSHGHPQTDPPARSLERLDNHPICEYRMEGIPEFAVW